MKGRTPTVKEKKWMDDITQIGCVVCRLEMETFSFAEVHHLDGKVKPDAHLNSIPLCFYHHRGGQDNEMYTARHPFKKRFIDRYGTEEWLLDATQQMVEVMNASRTTF